jgi:hypothetical protein
MSTDALRKRGGERAIPDTQQPSSPSSSSLRIHFSRLRRVLSRPRTRTEKIRLLSITLCVLTFFFCALCTLLCLYPSLAWVWRESEEEWLRRHIICPTDTLIDIPSLRPRTGLSNDGKTEAGGDRRGAFAFDASETDGIPGYLTTVTGLSDFCALRVSAVPQWASGSWRKWNADPSKTPGAAKAKLVNPALFNLTIAPNFLANATYTAVGSPFCLSRGGLYLTQERISAGGTEVFEAEGLTVMMLTDEVLQKAAASATNASTGLHVVPAMGLLLSGYWIATHFFHLITDALETLYGAFHTMEAGALMHIPTQTVMVCNGGKNWIDRRGDRAKKMEFSAALANGFSSPLLRNTSPYNTSFLFRPESPYCVGREGKQRRMSVAASAVAGANDTSSPPSAAAASAVCFCDGLLVTTHNHPFMDARVYYGIQDWAAQEFGAPPYLERRSVREMEHLRLAQSPPWATHFWREAPLPSLPAATQQTSYRPRVVFIHRTTRLIANATRYAAWMREFGFRVEEVYMEQLTAAQQYHLGRYADVVVGMHGLAIGHAMWMEREPHGCRTVIEFRPWVIQSMPLQPLRLLGQTMKFRFIPIYPTDVLFGPSVKEPEKERELLLSVERINSAFSFTSFTDQTAIYDDAEVRRVFWAVGQHLSRCLPK